MTVFNFSDYRKYMRFWAENRPDKRGAYARIAEKIGASSTMVSQILNGQKNLSPEMTQNLVDYFGLNEMETDYFFYLVELDRAGTLALRTRHLHKLKELREKSKELSHRVKKDQELDDSAKAIFYSSWLYSGVRNLSAIEGSNSIDAIAAKLALPREAILRVVNFLNEQGLLEKNGDLLSPKSKLTHIPATSPLVIKHHQNWRLRGFQKMDSFNSDDFYFTGPMSLSKELADEIRHELPAFIESIGKKLGPSKSETARCLNIDWFEY